MPQNASLMPVVSGESVCYSLFYDKADVAPAAPFVMRRALRVAAAGFFIVRVRLRHKFRECGVHLHVVRNKPYGQGWIFVLRSTTRTSSSN